MRVCQNRHILFFCAKPRLSQARALLCRKVFVPLQNMEKVEKVSMLCVKRIKKRKGAKHRTNKGNYDTRCRIICPQDER